MKKILKSIFAADCIMAAFFFVAFCYYFMMLFVSAPNITITGLPDWEIFNCTMPTWYYFVASLSYLFAFGMWEIFALRDYDRIKKTKNPRVA